MEWEQWVAVSHTAPEAPLVSERDESSARFLELGIPHHIVDLGAPQHAFESLPSDAQELSLLDRTEDESGQGYDTGRQNAAER